MNRSGLRTRTAIATAHDYRSSANALERLAATMEWGDDRAPFAKALPPGSRVLIKPNLVMHKNEDPGFGIEELVTHASLIQAAAEAALRSDIRGLVIGDAPIQSCNFPELLKITGLGRWAENLQKKEPRFHGIRDFRRTTCVLVGGIRVANEQLKPLDQFVLFDLGMESLLEPVTNDRAPFRVTWYDPRLMARTHKRGRHQYLVAREVIEADVVINLPKLKTHKKAGLTCALKNLIGINGNKEYLPHHRLGGSAAGGDCYPGGSPVKRAMEYVADQQNRTASYASGFLCRCLTFGLTRVERALTGDRLGIEGSWSGNDTIWRTCLDLNRILLYGLSDGTLSDGVQRRVIHIADAITAGQGNGPLSPEPLAMGLLLASDNAAVMDWVGAGLLAYDPLRIPVIREAFGRFRWPITADTPERIHVAGDFSGNVEEFLDKFYVEVRHPAGWVDAARSIQGTVAT